MRIILYIPQEENGKTTWVREEHLLDAEARDHLSFLKEVLPLPGRGVVIGLRTTF